jgi:hypothetical protein
MTTGAPAVNEMSRFDLVLGVSLHCRSQGSTPADLSVRMLTATVSDGAQRDLCVKILSAADALSVQRIGFWLVTFLFFGIPYVLCMLAMKLKASLKSSPFGRFVAAMEALKKYLPPAVSPSPSPSPSPGGANSPTPTSAEELCEFFFGPGAHGELMKALKNDLEQFAALFTIASFKDPSSRIDYVVTINNNLNMKLTQKEWPGAHEDEWNNFIKAMKAAVTLEIEGDPLLFRSNRHEREELRYFRHKFSSS